MDPIKCYVTGVGEVTEETCDSGTCEKLGGMYLTVSRRPKSRIFTLYTNLPSHELAGQPLQFVKISTF